MRRPYVATCSYYVLQSSNMDKIQPCVFESKCKILNQDQDVTVETNDSDRLQNTEWCSCGNCVEMNTEEETYCNCESSIT